MQDRLIYAPITSTAPSTDLHILDSACNDGTWMLDVIAHRTAQLPIPVDAKLNFLRTDLDKKHFSSLKPRVGPPIERQHFVPSPGDNANLARESP
jgi:hypothetical protein